MSGSNLKFSYVYIDGNNNKFPRDVVAKGKLTPVEIRTILDCCQQHHPKKRGLHSSFLFIPSQVGLENLQVPAEPIESDLDRNGNAVDLSSYDPYQHGPDHAWHHLAATSIEDTDEEPTIALTAKKLLTAFKAASDNWDEESALVQLRKDIAPALAKIHKKAAKGKRS